MPAFTLGVVEMFAGVLLSCGLLLPVSMGQETTGFDWPQWRGPQRDGFSRETGLLDRWPEAGPPLIWRAEKLGGGYSTPSVAGGRIFGLSYRGDEEVVWALDEKSGRELWVSPLGPKGKLLYNDGPRSTPTVDRDRLYVLGVSGEVACLDIKNGKILWRRCLVREFGGKMMSNWGFSESPLVDGDRLVITPGSDRAALAALDKRNGKTIWESPIPDCGGAGYSSIMPICLKELKLYVTWLGMKKDLQGKWTAGKGLVGVDAESGRFLWNCTRIANATANIPTVLIRGDTVFCSNGYPDGGTCVIRVRATPDGATTEELAYRPAKNLQNHHGGMVGIGDSVYLGRGQQKGIPTCVDFTTLETRWSDDRCPGRGSAAVSGADGMLYFRYEDGNVALIEANPKEYRLVSQFKLPKLTDKPGWAHPVIANGKLLLRDQDYLSCYDVKKK